MYSSSGIVTGFVVSVIIYDVKTTVPVNLLINFALARPSTALFVGGLNYKNPPKDVILSGAL